MRARKTRPRPIRTSHLKLTSFANRLWQSWKDLDLPVANDAVVVAVSGGADSTALFLAVEELRRLGRLDLKVVAAHLDHGLRDDSKSDAQWVTGLANKLQLENVTKRVNVDRRALLANDNLEQAARGARYEFLLQAARKQGATVVLTAHTMDDQAETVMLNLLRGSGSDGLAGINPRRVIQRGTKVTVARPLLSWARRCDTESYCRSRKVEFLNDSMNVDEQFARVRVRRQLLPQMQSFNKKVVEALARTAELSRQDGEALTQQAEILLDAASEPNKGETNPAALNVRVLVEAAVSIRRRALRQWILRARGDLRRCELVHIQAIEKLLAGDEGGRTVELPGGAKIKRNKCRIELLV